MKYRLLRFSLLCMLVMLCGGSVWAQDVTATLTGADLLASTSPGTSYADYTASETFTGLQDDQGNAYFGRWTYQKNGQNYLNMVQIKKVESSNTTRIQLPKYSGNIKTITLSVTDANSTAYDTGTGAKTQLAIINSTTYTSAVAKNANNQVLVVGSSSTARKTYEFDFTQLEKSYNGEGLYICSIDAAARIWSIVVTYDDGSSDTRAETTLEFGDHQATGSAGGSMDLPSVTVKTVDGATTLTNPEITWASSNTTVATIADGTISFLKGGKTTITASYAGDDTQYKSCSNSFDLTIGGAITDGVFDFNNNQDYGSGATVDASAYITEDKTWTAGNVTLVTSGKYRWYTDGSLRIYAPDEGNTTLKLSVPEGYKITAITITGSSINDLTASTGTYSSGTWSGSSQEVTLSRGSNNSQIKTITVTYTSASAPEAPTFSPAGGTYEEPQAVILSTTTDEATIYYSTDGEIFSVYSGAISVTETTTISAYTKKGEEESATVTATYTINPPITTITDLNAAATQGGSNGASVKYKFTDIYVAYVSGYYNYITDGTNYALLYGSNLDLTAGDQISGSLTGNAKVYNGLPEIAVTASDLSILSQTAGAFTPEASIVTVDQLSDNVNKFIKIENATYVSASGSNLTFKVGETDFTVRNQFSYDVSGLEANKAYNITGFGSVYNTTYQVYPTEITEYVTPTPDPLYILGVNDANENGDWDIPDEFVEMTWNTENEAYTYELNNTTDAYFCFSTNNEVSDWDTFNSTYRWALGTGGDYTFDLDNLGTALELSQGDKTIVLPAGEWTISVTADKKLTITGEATPVTPTEAKYYVVGTMTNWQVDESYEMTRNEGADIDEYSFTMDLTTESQFKVVKKVEGEDDVWYPNGTNNNYGENGEITADGTYTVYFRPNYDGGDDWFYYCIYVAAEEEPEPFVFRDIKLDLTVQGFLTDDEYNNKSAVTAKLLVDEEGNISRNDDATEPNVIVTGKTRKDDHGWDNFTMTAPVTGKVKITIGGCEYNSSSKVLTVTPEGGEAFTIAAPAACWHSAKTKNIKSGYFDAGEQTVTLTITGPEYTPYVAIEAVDEIPSIYTVTYAKESDVEGTIPAEVEVTIGEAITLPKNYTLYKEGYTQTGWTDGTTTHELGGSFTPEDDVTLTAVFTENTVNLADRTEAVTITFPLNGNKTNGLPLYNINNSGIIVTQATVGNATIDVKASITSGTLATNESGYHQVKNNFKATIPSCKGATVVINTYDDPTSLLTFGESTVFEVSGSDNAWTATYTATADATSLDIAQSGSTYWSSLAITLPVVSGEDPVSGTIFSADVIATEVQNFATGTTEITSAQATIVGGKMYAISAQEEEKALINKQNNIYYFSMTNNNTYFKVELDHALAVGDVITANGNGGVKNNLPKGLWVSASDTYPTEAPACAGTNETDGFYDNLLSYTVEDGDEYVGKKTLYIFRAAGATQYFDNFAITRPADEPVAEDVTAMWDFEHNCANLASKNDGGAYTETTMASNVEGVSMTIAYNGGQIKNNDNSYQITNGVVMQIPVKNAGDEVTVVGYPGYYSYSIGGTAATAQTTTHKATADEAAQGYVAVASTSNDNYINSITVTQYAPKPVGLKEKAIIDTDFQDWAKSSTTTEVTTKYTKENITFTYSKASVDPEATNEDKFPTSTDAAYKGYIMSEKSEATITTTTFNNISKIRYRHGATGSNRGWGLKMKVGDGEWETVSDATVGSTPQWIEKTIDKENVQLQWYNLNTSQNAYMFELEVYAKVDLSNSPLLGTLKANGTTYTADDIFEMGTDNNYAATIELASSEAMPSAENPVEAVADNGEIGDITYDASNDQSIVTIPVTAGEASVNYVATFVRKPKFTLTYYNLDGEEIGTQQVEKDAKIGEFAYNIADVQAKTDGYKARGWFKNNYVGEKWTTESVITADAKLYAVETEIEVSSDFKEYEYDLTDKNFDANDHEAFNPIGNGKYHNEHGWIFGNGDKIELLVGKKATISVGLCQYSAAGSTISASNDESIKAVAETCGSTGAIEYEGDAGTLTLTINSTGSVYIHSIDILNTTTTNYEVNGDWIIVKEDDASSLAAAIKAAKDGARIFVPNGTYDLGQKTKTKIGRNNVSIIGESMEGVIIKNKPTTEGIDVTATLLNTSSNLYMQDLTIECDAPWIGNAERGVTLQDKGNQTILKNVYLKGKQDTYYSNNPSGTFYFEDGKIQGSVDYVCGHGDVYFNKTSFYTINKSTGGIGGCIAAPNTLKSFGYIFSECTLDGVENEDGQYRLARPWAADTKCFFVNTTMIIQPNAAGWGEWGTPNAVNRFAEYNSVDAKGDAIDLTGRAKTIGGQTNNPELTEAEAAALAVDQIFAGDWKPQVIAQQVAAPKAQLSKDGKKIEWTPANDGATAYAIFKDGKFLGITTGSEWTIEEVAGAPALRRAEEPEKTGYTIRAANSRGGFGPAAEVSPATGIAAIEAELGGDVKIYDLNGRRVMTPTKGVYIINGKKVVIK